MNLSAIFSKTGKGVQEASGKTSQLSRADRTVLSAIDGKTSLSEVQKKFEKLAGPKFESLIQQLDKDGFIREVSSSSQPAPAPPARSAAPAKAAPPPAGDGGDDEMDFTQAVKLPPRAPPPAAPRPPPVDLAAASRAEAERKAKEQQAFDYKARAEGEAKAKAEAEANARAAAQARARADAEAKARAAAEEQTRAEAEAKGRADAESKTRAEADAKVRAAREAAVRMATEANAKAGAADRERQAAEERARKGDEDKARLESELNAKLAEERKAREDAERRAGEATQLARRELEEKAKRDAEELRQRLEAEMKAKLEEERKAREADDRKRREDEDRKRAEEDRKRREEDERRRKEEDERRAKEEAERKAREEEDRKRRAEEDRKRREEDERRRKEDEERRAKEAAERLARKEEEERRAKEEADRRKHDEERRAKDEADRRAKEEAERRAREEQDSKRRKEEEERRAKDDADRRKREEEDRRNRAEAERRAKDDAERRAKEEAEAKARAAQSASASMPSIQPTVAPPPPPPAAAGGIDDALLADLDSFGQREEEEQKAKEEAERKAKEAAARKAKEEAERRAKDDADRRAKEEAEKKRREEEERKAKEEAEQRAREEEERQEEEEAERKRKAKETLAAKEAERKAALREATAKSAGKGADDDIEVTDDDLGMDDVKKDQKALSATARKAAREQAPVAAAAVRRPMKWGKPAAIALFLLLVGGVGVLHVMPVSTAEYEKAASEAMGVPVKIGSARLSLITGIEARFEGVSIGDTVKIRTVRGFPEIGSLFGAKKSFSRIELEGVSLSQAQLADAVLGKVAGENFRVARIVIKQAKFDGPLALPALDVDAAVSGDGSLQSVSLLGGPDKLSVRLSPKGSEIGFEISAGSLALPFAPALNLSEFSMKGTANRGGVTMSEFDGRAFDGVISGSAKIRWGANWVVDGEVRARGVKVAVIAPALVSEGKVEGRGAYAMSGPNPATLFESARLQGEFKIEKGVLGSFDLTRALQTGGAQSGGRTIFTELTGQAVYDKGTVKVTNVAIAAGAMNAGASLDVDANGALSGRIVADVKTPNQTLRATLNVSGKIQDPVIRK